MEENERILKSYKVKLDQFEGDLPAHEKKNFNQLLVGHLAKLKDHNSKKKIEFR